MFVQVRSVEIPECVFVGRKVRRAPIEDDANVVLVQVIDQVHQVLTAAVPSRWCEIATGLVAPRRVERVFHDRQELDMGKAHLLDIIGQHRSQFPIAEQPIGFARVALPRAQVDLVDAVGGVEAVVLTLLAVPGVVAPVVLEVPDDRRGVRRQLPEEGEGIAFVDGVVVVFRVDVVFVDCAPAQFGDEPFPDA